MGNMFATVKPKAKATMAHISSYRLWRPADTRSEVLAAARFKVAILVLPQASLANVCAVFEDLAAVNTLPGAEPGRLPFAARIVAETPAPFTSLSGVSLAPHGDLETFGAFDAVIVPTLYDDGSLSIADQAPILTTRQRDWLRAQHGAGAIFSTMCSGVFALAETGLIGGAAVAMHPLYAATFAHRFPDIPASTRKSLVVSGTRDEFISGGYSTYSADVSLYLIARFVGPETALHFAKLYRKDWTEPLPAAGEIGRSANSAPDMTVSLAQRFIQEHLHAPSLVSAAAAMAHLDERTFCRRFTRATGLKPSSYIARERMRRAGDLLIQSRMPIDDVAARVGYHDRSSFSKAFKSYFEQTPAQYRRRHHAPLRLT